MLRVFIADDSIGFPTLASAWLEGADDIEVVGAARTAEEALEAVVAAAPDVVLLDRLLPQPEHSARVLAHVREHLPGTAVLLVSGMSESDLADEAQAAGADAHISKAANAETLVAAVRRAAAQHAQDA